VDGIDPTPVGTPDPSSTPNPPPPVLDKDLRYILPHPRVLGTWLLVAGLLAGGISWIVLPQWRERVMSKNEYAASRILWLLTTAESTFRSKDLDRNRLDDFWTGDVAGLYSYGLIPREVAEADAAPLKPLVPKPVPYRGHFFKALTADGQKSPPEPYAQVTDKASGRVHHSRSFGFTAYPAEPGVTGRRYWVINENNTVFPRMAEGSPPVNFPTDDELKRFYSKE